MTTVKDELNTKDKDMGKQTQGKQKVTKEKNVSGNETRTPMKEEKKTVKEEKTVKEMKNPGNEMKTPTKETNVPGKEGNNKTAKEDKTAEMLKDREEVGGTSKVAEVKPLTTTGAPSKKQNVPKEDPAAKVEESSTRPVREATEMLEAKVEAEKNSVSVSNKKTSEDVTNQEANTDTANGGKKQEDEKEVTFEWPGPGTHIELTGSFWLWEQRQELKSDEGNPCTKVRLPKGKHLYKYIVDNTWHWDITKPTETDCVGNVNNVLEI